MQRDWLDVGSKSEATLCGRILLRSPHEIGLVVAHERISYGTFIEKMQDGHILPMLKKAIFEAVRDVITESTLE